MLKQRVMTACILLPFVLGGIFFLPTDFFAWALVPIFMIAAKEWGKLISPQSNATQWRFCLTSGLLLSLLNWLIPASEIWYAGELTQLYQSLLVLGGFWWFLSAILVVSFPKSQKFWQGSDTIKSMFGHLTLIPCFIALMTLKSLSDKADPYYGAMLVCLVCLVVWAADTGAYFFGRSLGRHKLMPKVSPGKTLEGLAGGLLTTMLIVALVMYLSPEQELPLVILVILVTAIASALGDLSESMFKRSADIKDSGTIIPGHGGLLDRIDSLTAALPVFALIYTGFWM